MTLTLRMGDDYDEGCLHSHPYGALMTSRGRKEALPVSSFQCLVHDFKALSRKDVLLGESQTVKVTI